MASSLDVNVFQCQGCNQATFNVTKNVASTSMNTSHVIPNGFKQRFTNTINSSAVGNNSPFTRRELSNITKYSAVNITNNLRNVGDPKRNFSKTLERPLKTPINHINPGFHSFVQGLPENKKAQKRLQSNAKLILDNQLDSFNTNNIFKGPITLISNQINNSLSSKPPNTTNTMKHSNKTFPPGQKQVKSKQLDLLQQLTIHQILSSYNKLKFQDRNSEPLGFYYTTNNLKLQNLLDKPSDYSIIMSTPKNMSNVEEKQKHFHQQTNKEEPACCKILELKTVSPAWRDLLIIGEIPKGFNGQTSNKTTYDGARVADLEVPSLDTVSFQQNDHVNTSSIEVVDFDDGITSPEFLEFLNKKYKEALRHYKTSLTTYELYYDKYLKAKETSSHQ